MTFKQLSTPLKILAVLFGLGLAWVIYMVGFLTLSLPLSPEQMKNVNATKTAIAERWYMLLRPGFTGTPTITLTPSITPTPTQTATITLTPTNTPTPSRTPYYSPTVAGQQAGALFGSSATSVVFTPITPLATFTPAQGTPLPTLPLPTLPLPTLPLPTQPAPTQVPPTQPPPTEPPPTEDPNLNNGHPTRRPHPKIAFRFPDRGLEINNNIIVMNWMPRFPRHFR